MWTVRVGKEETRAVYEAALGEVARGVYVLAHGAGGNMETKGLVREAKILRGLGWGVVRFNFLYRERGRAYPDKMPVLMECYRAVVESVEAEILGKARDASGRPRVWIGGHSMGGRVATMLAAEGFACDGLILFSYPLHPPGKFEQLRAEHLPKIRVPVLCFSGTRDDFMRRDLMEGVMKTLPATWTQHWVEGADHSLAVKKASGRTNAEVEEEIAGAVREWMGRSGFEI